MANDFVRLNHKQLHLLQKTVLLGVCDNLELTLSNYLSNILNWTKPHIYVIINTCKWLYIIFVWLYIYICNLLHVNYSCVMMNRYILSHLSIKVLMMSFLDCWMPIFVQLHFQHPHINEPFQKCSQGGPLSNSIN